jgi:dihydrofolate synthase/folylpolyglutamate synthase
MPNLLRDWLERIQENHPDTIELGLDRCTVVWERMGRPRPAPKVITVAGTNGKGSTIAGIEAALIHLGRRVGCYTSPHLLRYQERIRINGSDADERTIVTGFEAVDAARQDTRLTYFEFATLAAFATMEMAQLDVAILEVGLGGRLDAVNVIDADLGVITAIGIDHQEFLGDNRESIGYEKAGIMRPGQIVVCSDREPPESVFEAADKLDVRLICIGSDFEVSRETESGQPRHWRYFYADESMDFPVSIDAAHLADNLAGALTAVLSSEPTAQPRLQELAAVVAGCRVKGRLDQVATAPDVFVDVGHNPLAALAIRDFLEHRACTNCVAVIAMLDDKDAEGVVTTLGDYISRWYCAGIDGPRGQTAESLADRIRRVLPNAGVVDHPNVAMAIDSAMRDSGSRDTLLIFGSFLTAAEAIRHFETI